MFFNNINMITKISVVVVLFFLETSNSAKILGIFPQPSPSHQIVYRSVTDELVRRGHHVTVMTPNPVEKNAPDYANLTQIDVGNVSYETWRGYIKSISARFIDSTHMSHVLNYADLTLSIAEKQLSHPDMKKLIKDPKQKFDLCIVESNSMYVYAFKDRFKCPLIQINSIGLTPQDFVTFGSPMHVLMHMHIFASYDPHNLNMFQKLELIYSDITYKLYYYFYYIPMFTKLTRKHFGANTRAMDVVERESDLVLMNYHPVLHGVMPRVPVMIPIANIHIKPPKPLPENIQKIMDEAKEGIIYFSLGSNVRSSLIPKSKRDMFLSVFRELPYTIIWKFEVDNLLGKPSNVYIFNWLPQQSVLAHPNVKLFITQGGKQSMEEAIYYGVPVIGMAFFADQFANCHRMERKGAGLNIQFDKISNETTIKRAIIEVISNPKYKKNMENLRALVTDEEQTPMERAMWWIEYVIRHKGAKHLRSPIADASYFQYYMIDVFLFHILVIVAVFYFVKFIIRIYSRYSINIRATMKKLD